MPKNPREYLRATEATQALEWLKRRAPRTAVLMPGPRTPNEPLAEVEAAVDVSTLGLDSIEMTGDGGLRLGAMVSLQSLAGHEAVRGLAGGLLAEAALLAGGNAQRQAATLGGAVRQHIGAMSGVTRDGPPEVALALLVLDARLAVRGVGGEKVMPLPDYYSTGGMLAMDDLLWAVHIPAQPAGARGTLARVARTPKDQAIVAAAAVRAPGVMRIAVAGATPRPVRLGELEAALAAGEVVAGELVARVEALMAPTADFRASAEYRRKMAGVMVSRAASGVAGQ